MTQKYRVCEKLKQEGEVSNLWAIENRIWRLGAIICVLRKKGWNIETKMNKGVAIYKLV